MTLEHLNFQTLRELRGIPAAPTLPESLKSEGFGIPSVNDMLGKGRGDGDELGIGIDPGDPGRQKRCWNCWLRV